MNRRFSLMSSFTACISGLAVQVFASVSIAEDKVNFEDHVKPILREKCLTCHNTNKKSSDLDLSSYSSLMQGGASGASVEAGDSGASYLYSLVSHQGEPFMPPNADKLPDATLDIIKQWIDAGAPETSSSKVVLPKKKNAAMTVDVAAGARPEGDPPMPDVLSVEPVVHTSATTAVTAVATNPWSKLVAVAGQKQIVLYHTETLEPLGILPFPEGTAHVLKFSRNGALLLAGGGRGGAKGLCVVWDIKTGERIMTVGDELDEVLAADISADQSLVALGGPEKIVRVYNTSTGELAYECRKHTDWIYSVEFSPDGVLLATSDRSGGLMVWEAHTGREYLILNGHTAAVTSVSWRIDGNVLASASEDTTIRLWEMENGGQIKSWGAHGGGVFSVEYTRDGRIVSSGRDKVTKLWDGNGAALKDFEAFSDLALQVTHCDETNRVIAGDWTGEIRVWNAADGTRIGQLTTNPPTLDTRLADAQSQVAPTAEKLVAATTERDAASAALAAQLQKIEMANATLAAAQKKVTDQQALVVAEEQKLVAEQTKDQTLTVSISALQKAVPDLKSAAEKSAAAFELAKTDEELKKIVDLLTAQVAAREAELKTSETELATTKANVVTFTNNVAAQKTQVTADEQVMIAAKGTVDTETAALPPFQEASTTKEQALAAVQQEVSRANALVTRWQLYIALRDELAVLDTTEAQRDEVQLKSLQTEATLQEKQQQIAVDQKTMQEAQAAVAASDQKMKDLTASVATIEAQKTVQADIVTKTQAAVPMLKAALVQTTAALAVLPENTEIKSATESLAAVAERQEKSLVTMTEQIAVMDKSIIDAKAEMEVAAKTVVAATETMQTAEKSIQTLTAEVPAVQEALTTATAELTTAEQSVEAAATVVETRRQQLRPQLQLTSSK